MQSGMPDSLVTVVRLGAAGAGFPGAGICRNQAGEPPTAGPLVSRPLSWPMAHVALPASSTASKAIAFMNSPGLIYWTIETDGAPTGNGVTPAPLLQRKYSSVLPCRRTSLYKRALGILELALR